jgi:hypothetical protein
MRRIFVVLIVVVATFFKSEAQSMLKVRVAGDRPINVWLDGRYFNKRGTSVTVGDLPPGSHMLRVYAMAEDRWGRPSEKVIYHGRVSTYEGTLTSLYYDPYTNETNIRQMEMGADTRGSMLPPASAEPQQQPQNNSEYDDNQQPSSPVASPVSQETGGSLTEATMEKLKTKVTAKKVDVERMNTIKEALDHETFTTDQVSSMMDWFGFESSKVEFAEWAYNKTVDKEMFGDLAAKLTYQNYRDEFEKFLQAQKQ